MPTGPAECTVFTDICGEFVTSQRADVGIGPYKCFTHRVRIFGLLQISREKSRKIEAVFLVALKGAPGGNRNPPGSFSFCHFFFWRSKRKSETAVEISMSVPALMCASRRLPFQGVPLGHCTAKKCGAEFLLVCTECRGNSVRFGRSAWMNAQKRQIKIVKNVDTASKKECGWLPFRAKSQRVRGK